MIDFNQPKCDFNVIWLSEIIGCQWDRLRRIFLFEIYLLEFIVGKSAGVLSSPVIAWNLSLTDSRTHTARKERENTESGPADILKKNFKKKKKKKTQRAASGFSLIPVTLFPNSICSDRKNTPEWEKQCNPFACSVLLNY